MTNCPVCKTRMLTYENPFKLKCPRENRHYQFLGGMKLGKADKKSARARRKKKR